MSLIDYSDRERRLAGRIDTGVADNLVISSAAGGLSFVNIGQVMEFAKMMALAQVGVRKHLRGNPGACLAICVQAVEWEMSPFAVANKSYSVNDQIAFESQLIQAVILKRAPIKGRFKVEYSGVDGKRKCKVIAELKDSPGEFVEYESPEFDKITPKNSPLWKTDPDQQQFYYSGRALCRRHFPDVLLGVYADDELSPAPRVGPDQARDVTPRNLASKLDALAGMQATEMSSQDAETVSETNSESEPGIGAESPEDAAQTEGAGDQSSRSSAPEGSEAGEQVSLLDQARSKTFDGNRAFNAWFHTLTKQQQAELKPELAALLKAAMAAGE